MDVREFWKIIGPKPAVLVTTIGENGKPDVAPFSFIAPVSFDPPLLILSVGPNKHSYWNITRRKEFVVNIPTKKMLDKVWTAGQKFDSQVSKIERAGLKTEPSTRVGAPRLSECIAHMECYLESARKTGDHILIVGKVMELNVNPRYLDDRNGIDITKVRPPLHLYENKFTFPKEIVEV